MDRRAEAAAVDRSFVTTFLALSSWVDAGVVRTVGRVPVAATRLPVAFFNAAFVTESLPVGATDLASAIALLRDLGVPFTVHLRTDIDPASRAAADGLGLVSTGLLPGMALRPGRVPDPPRTLSIRRATDEAALAAHRSTAAAGFGMPLGIVERLIPAAILTNRDVRVYVGTADGAPVATSMAVRTGGILGIYNVATIASARGHGYGTAMTWAAIADASAGVEVAVLQASALGLPIYERMGFRTVVEYEELEASATATPGVDSAV